MFLILNHTHKKLWTLGYDKCTLHVCTKMDTIESKHFSWCTIYLPKEFDCVDASVCLDKFDDLTQLVL